MSERVLVTGGAGFIGSHLAEALLARGYAVRVLDNFATGRRTNVRLGEIELLEGDIRRPGTVAAAVKDCDVVFHQAALPSVLRSVHDPRASHATNALGTRNVLLAARTAGVRRVIAASSSSVYGAAAALPNREDDPVHPISPYAASKLAGERWMRRMHGLETVALRYFNVFGPRQDPDTPYAAVVPAFITALREGRAPVVHGDGRQSRDFTYVGNAVYANLLALAAPPGVYNVAGGEAVSVLDLLAQLSELLGVPAAPAFRPPRPADMRHTHADLARARTLLRYEPVISLREGLERTVRDWPRSVLAA
jgi:UDP-glucose 4-epimerase